MGHLCLGWITHVPPLIRHFHGFHQPGVLHGLALSLGLGPAAAGRELRPRGQRCLRQRGAAAVPLGAGLEAAAVDAAPGPAGAGPWEIGWVGPQTATAIGPLAPFSPFLGGRALLEDLDSHTIAIGVLFGGFWSKNRWAIPGFPAVFFLPGKPIYRA